MSESFTIHGGYIAAEVDLQPNGLYGAGRLEFPMLVVPLRFRYLAHEQIKCGLIFRELCARLSPFEGTHIAAGSMPLRAQVKPGAELKDQYIHLQIPIDQMRLAAIERQRNGGDVHLRLDMELIIDEIVPVGQTKDTYPLPLWVHRGVESSQAKMQVTIPRSRWLEQVLPGTGFGSVHWIELPAIPIESCAIMKSAVEALQLAVKLEREGYYDEAVAKCRIALESFCEKVDKPDDKGGTKKVPKLKAAWQTRLGQRTFDWLDSSLGAVRQATNQSHHISSSSFGQLEAQMLLTVTTALLAYACKTSPTATS